MAAGMMFTAFGSSESAIRYLQEMDEKSISSAKILAKRSKSPEVGGFGGHGGFNGYEGGGFKRKRGPPVDGVDGAWACPRAECGNVNFAQRVVCNRCQAPCPSR